MIVKFRGGENWLSVSFLLLGRSSRKTDLQNFDFMKALKPNVTVFYLTLRSLGEGYRMYYVTSVD